ncbi:hypothetical protein GCM10022395_21400 [Snuella lapsa]|uniref:Bacterial membrane protein YfhO n=2 Tax=Snuella lapsa TaxID=870481 RepID=A0ABP6XSC7_9FLAO
MILSTQLNIGATVISNRNFKAAQDGFNTLQDGFSTANYHNNTIKDAIPEKSNALNIPGLYHNLNIFDKQIGFDGSNPFQLTNYNLFKESHYFNTTLNNKLIFLSDSIFPIKEIDTQTPQIPSHLFFNDADYHTLSRLNLSTHQNDNITITTFSPNKIVAKTHTKTQQVITLLQNNYPGWEVYINKQKREIYTTNNTLISAILPSGNNTIEFRYTPKLEILGGIIALITLVLCLLYSILKFRRMKESQ